MFKVAFYRTTAGGEPVCEWLQSLARDEKAAIGTDLFAVQEGFPMGMPLCRPMGDGLFELRSRLPTGRIARLIFFQRGEHVVMVAGFVKKTQKTPVEELALARRRKKEIESRD